MTTEKWTLGVGLAHEFEIMGRKTGWENADLAVLATDERANRMVLAFLRRHAELKVVEHLIDCDAQPFMPEWAVGIEEHVKGGHRAWDASKVKLHLDKGQKGGKYVEGHELRKKLKDQPVLNANVLDYLLANQHLIPEDWKGKTVFFWGTIYRNADGELCVRYLYWSDGRWHSLGHWLDDAWSSGLPAAVSAS